LESALEFEFVLESALEFVLESALASALPLESWLKLESVLEF